MTIYTLEGIGDSVNYTEQETDKMCEALKAHLSEYTEPPGAVITITVTVIRSQDFKRFA